MSRLMSRGAVLTASRLSNFGVLILSPLLLVRILEVEAYGQYQEFMIYAMFLVTVCSFSVDSSLTYFLPRNEGLEREVVSQTSGLILGSSTLCLAALILARPLILEFASYDFIWPLAAYVFCFVNLNWLEYYWIAMRRADLVLYYSAARVVVRVTVLIIVAYVTRDIPTILWSLVAVEAVRLIVVAIWLLRSRMFTRSWRPSGIPEQIRYSGPLGLATLIQQLGRNIGKLFIGSVMGPGALAYYAVGSYLIPLVRVIRHSISDVVFPELVRARDDPAVALQLWQRTNVMFCVLLFPVFVILTFHSELVVRTLFTEAYLPAVPVFQVYLLWILRRCFNADVLLRTRGKTGLVLTGTILVLTLNLALMYALYRQLGLIGPAVAFIAAEVLLEFYYTNRASRELRLPGTALIDWTGIWRVAAGCIVGLPLLITGVYVPGPELGRAALTSVSYVAIAWFISYQLGLTDIGRLVAFVATTAKKLMRRILDRRVA